ncbi:MAG: undecaprenyl-diphosphate phosphatase [Actinomycetes bacterium]|jgi:undecaprenyl-diphosphatase|nr:undecaprenyl-diphosphate phosphatase [Actinomycetes bacterium]
MGFLVKAPQWVYALVMGLAQGLTEFLPVSSSGHLSLLNLAFGRDTEAGIEFTFFLHIATLIASLVYFRQDIARLIVAWKRENERSMAGERRICVFLIVGCLITGPMGLLLEDKLAPIAGNIRLLGGAFLLTTIVLVVAERLLQEHPHRQMNNLGLLCSAIVGFAQGCAVIPGLSRSGSTIAGGMLTGMSREQSTRFSFLLGIPIIIAGALKDGLDLARGQLTLPPMGACVIGFIAAAVAGYFAIAWMIKLVQKTQLYWFAGYTFILGVCLIVASFF